MHRTTASSSKRTSPSKQRSRSLSARTAAGALASLALAVGGTVGMGTGAVAASASTTPFYAAAAASSAGGGWAVTGTGQVLALAGARTFGSVSHLHGSSVVAIAATPDGNGYLVGTDTGRIFAFGDARYAGSLPHTDGALTGLATAPHGHGYWISTSDGRVFAYGTARFEGSPAHSGIRSYGSGTSSFSGTSIAAAPDGKGYWVSTSSGHVYGFGGAPYRGSAASERHLTPITQIVAAPEGIGYALYGAHGTLLDFGADHASTKASSGSVSVTTVGGRTYVFVPSRKGRGAPADTSGASGDSGGTGSGSTSGGASSTGSAGAPLDAAQASAASVGLPFAGSSLWNSKLPSSSTPGPNSSVLVNDFVQQYKNAYGTVGINTTEYSSPDYTVPASQPTVRVTALNCSGGTWVNPNLQSQLDSVPIPSNAMSAAGSDADMIVYQPSTGDEWELWEASKVNGIWQACAGGEITNAPTSSGVFPSPFGVAASGLSLLGGQIHLSDIAAGSIDHALEIQIPNTTSGSFVSPADRTDGWSTATDAIPEGTRFRLNPNVNLGSLGLSPAAFEIAQALQQYGMVVSDTSGAVNFIAQDPTPLIQAGQSNPYDAWFGGDPSYSVLSGIPWNQLQVVAS